MTKIITVVSGNGGTGKSTITANLAKKLAECNKSVLVADLCKGSRADDILLELENSVVFNLHDIEENTCDIESALVSHPTLKQVKLLSSADDFFADAFKFSATIKNICNSFDYIIIDVPQNYSGLDIIYKEITDLLLVCVTPDIVSVRAAKNIISHLFDALQKPARIIINKISYPAMTCGGIKDIDYIIDFIKIPLLALLPYDIYINEDNRQNLTDKVLTALAKRIIGEYIPVILRSV